VISYVDKFASCVSIREGEESVLPEIHPVGSEAVLDRNNILFSRSVTMPNLVALGQTVLYERT